jgi:PAS domain S-box-containing protein
MMNASPEATPRTTLAVLLVEDEEDDVALIRHALQSAALDAQITVTQSEEGFLRALAAKPDVILSDYHLPSFSGARALQLAQQHAPQLPFILLSGSVSEEVVVRLIKEGANDYLQKDRLTRLPTAIESAIAARRLKIEKEAAEEARARSERRFRALVEHAVSPMVLINRDGTLAYVSPAMLRMIGFAAEERVGRDTFELVHPEHLERVKQALAQAMAAPGASASVEFMLRRRDGEWRWIHAVYTNLLDDPDVSAIVSNVRDVTERVERETQLTRSEQRLWSVIEASYDGFWELSLHDDSVQWSQRTYEILGLDPGSFRPDREAFYALVHPDDRNRIRVLLRQALESGEVYRSEYRIRHADGTYRRVASRGRPLRDASGAVVAIAGVLSQLPAEAGVAA